MSIPGWRKWSGDRFMFESDLVASHYSSVCYFRALRLTVEVECPVVTVDFLSDRVDLTTAVLPWTPGIRDLIKNGLWTGNAIGLKWCHTYSLAPIRTYASLRLISQVYKFMWACLLTKQFYNFIPEVNTCYKDWYYSLQFERQAHYQYLWPCRFANLCGKKCKRFFFELPIYIQTQKWKKVA